MIIKHFEEFARNKNMAVPEVVGLAPSRTVHMERINVKSLRSEGKHCIGCIMDIKCPQKRQYFEVLCNLDLPKDGILCLESHPYAYDMGRRCCTKPFTQEGSKLYFNGVSCFEKANAKTKSIACTTAGATVCYSHPNNITSQIFP